MKIVMFLTVLFSFCFANTYHVAKTGNNITNNGLSKQAPWLTLTYAISQVVAGDSVLVYKGTYSEQFLLNGASGTAANKILYIAMDDSVIVQGGGAAETVFVQTNHIVLDGFIVGGSGCTSSNAVWFSDNLTGFEFYNNIVISDKNGGYNRGIAIPEGCNNFIIQGNRIIGKYNSALSYSGAISTNGASVQKNDNIKIINNTIYQTGSSVTQTRGIFANIHNNSVTISGNIVYIHSASPTVHNVNNVGIFSDALVTVAENNFSFGYPTNNYGSTTGWVPTASNSSADPDMVYKTLAENTLNTNFSLINYSSPARSAINGLDAGGDPYKRSLLK